MREEGVGEKMWRNDDRGGNDGKYGYIRIECFLRIPCDSTALHYVQGAMNLHCSTALT